MGRAAGAGGKDNGRPWRQQRLISAASFEAQFSQVHLGRKGRAAEHGKGAGLHAAVAAHMQAHNTRPPQPKCHILDPHPHPHTYTCCPSGPQPGGPCRCSFPPFLLTTPVLPGASHTFALMSKPASQLGSPSIPRAYAEEGACSVLKRSRSFCFSVGSFRLDARPNASSVLITIQVMSNCTQGHEGGGPGVRRGVKYECAEGE